jgi:hypothetical protein
MGTPREGFTATLLRTGKVLAAGGFIYDSNTIKYTYLDSAEIYDPATQTWTPTGKLDTASSSHQAVLLNDGRVLLVGGHLWKGKLYDPVSETWSDTGTMILSFRYGHTVTVLADGKVLVAGGSDGAAFTTSSEFYDPATNQWSSTTSDMNAPRYEHTATLLPDGKVLMVGGKAAVYDLVIGAAELYDPVSGTWSPTDSPTPRYEHMATLLPNGRVLISGGFGTDAKSPTPQLYDPLTGSFSDTAPAKADYLFGEATLLDNGKVLTASGTIPELYDPVSGTWNFTGAMTADSRGGHQAVRLRNGKILAVGGAGYVNYERKTLSSAELYEPEPPRRVDLPPLLAFYPLDGNVQDASGYHLHGQVGGGAPQVVTGYQGQAYSFNGTTDYLTVPVDINPSTFPKLTMGCWAKVASTWPLQQVLTHDNGDFDRSLGIDLRGAGVGWSAFCGPTGQVLGAMQGYMNTWTFVAVVYDQVAQTVKLMLDNQTITKAGASLGSGLNELYIGASPLFAIFFAGVIDNVFIYGDALSDLQLAYIRSRGAQGIMPEEGMFYLMPNKKGGAAVIYLE